MRWITKVGWYFVVILSGHPRDPLTVEQRAGRSNPCVHQGLVTGGLVTLCHSFTFKQARPALPGSRSMMDLMRPRSGRMYSIVAFRSSCPIVSRTRHGS